MKSQIIKIKAITRFLKTASKNDQVNFSVLGMSRNTSLEVFKWKLLFITFALKEILKSKFLKFRDFLHQNVYI